ncbi:MAG: hypothetical protein ABSG95_13880 [Solirubrobacteraceae bacterium]|jgi:hypothetical protein
MYASVRHYTMGAGSHDALMHRVDEEFAPAISQEPGFVGYFMLDTSQEPGAGPLALAHGDAMVEAVSIFHDKASAEQSNELAADYVRENLGEFQLTLTEVSGGEVLVNKVTAEALEDAHRWWLSIRARQRAR